MKKPTNDQIILEQIIKKRCAESDDEISISDYFEIYTASEILKDYDLSYDEIRYGIVGNSGDGGIDSIFTFLNGGLLKEDTSINYNQKKNNIDLFIIQSKTSKNFKKEDALMKFIESPHKIYLI